MNDMKRWIKNGAVGFVALLATTLVIVSGYLFGWKTGSADLDSPVSQVSSEPSAAKSAPSIATARPVPTTVSTNYESELEDVLRAAWTSYRFAPDRDVAAARLWELLSSLGEAELSTAFVLACELPGTDTKRNAIWMVLRHWAKVDPAGATEACARQFKGLERLDWMGNLLGLVAQSDPAAGYKAYRQHLAHLDGPSHDSAVFPLGGVFSAWIRKDFDQAWTEFQTLSPREKEYALKGMSGILNEASETGNKLLDRLNQSNDPALLDTTRAAMAARLGRNGDIDSARQWLDQQNLPAQTRINLENKIAQAWSHENPRAAADWLNKLSDPSDAGNRLREIVGIWADWEPSACANWLNQQLAEKRNMDKAIESFARRIASKDPAGAVSWAAHISDSHLRQKTAEYLGAQFHHRLVSNAPQIIQDSALSEADKEAALRKLNPSF